MSFTKKGMLRGLILGMGVLLLSACGGGGGSSHGLPDGPDPANKYKVGMTADKVNLPLNIAGVYPYPSIFCRDQKNGCGDAFPGGAYNATIHVNAYRSQSNDPIPGGEEIFGCLIADGLESGALYYLDGKAEHMTEVVGPDEATYEVPSAYRSLTLGANSGGASFHFVSSDTVGQVVIRCSATDPQSGETEYGDLTINVGDASGKNSQMYVSHLGPNSLLVQNSGYWGTTQRTFQVKIQDESDQLVADPADYNVLAWIDPTISDPLAIQGAQLRTSNFSGSRVYAKTIGGQAQITVVSGAHPGVIGIRLVSDRTDNNVMNGVTESISNLIGFFVYDADYDGPLTITTEELPEGYVLTPYVAMLEAEGGNVSGGYTWAEVGGVLASFGLTLNSDGTITGEPLMATAGEGVTIIVTVTDGAGNTATKSLLLKISDGTVQPVTVSTATLGAAVVGMPYVAVLEATGGIAPYTWSGTFNPALTGMSIDANGALVGTPAAVGIYAVTVTVTDARGRTATKVLTLEVNATGTPTIWVFGPAASTISTVTGGTVTVTVSGGTAPYSGWTVSSAPALTAAELSIVGGVITVAPGVAQATYTVTVGATDSSSPPVTKSGTISIVVGP